MAYAFQRQKYGRAMILRAAARQAIKRPLFEVVQRGRNREMKYCSKCGNELLDEAVICPKCGCPVRAEDLYTDRLIKATQMGRIKSASTLNFIAFIISFLLAVGFTAIFTYVAINRPSSPSVDYTLEVDLWTNSVTDIKNAQEEYDAATRQLQGFIVGGFVWAALSVVVFIWGRNLKKDFVTAPREKLVARVRIYILLAISIPALLGLLCSGFLWAMLSSPLGGQQFFLVFISPTIMQIIAGIKFGHSIPNAT